MSWLQSHKDQLDKEKSEKEEKEKKELELYEYWNKRARSELMNFVHSKLQEVVGLKTKDGKVLYIKEVDGYVFLMADLEPLLEMHCGMKEHEEYDRDGCKWGNGHYYTWREVKYCREYRKDGYTSLGGPNSRFCSLSGSGENEVAYYLLQFVEI